MNLIILMGVSGKSCARANLCNEEIVTSKV